MTHNPGLTIAMITTIGVLTGVADSASAQGRWRAYDREDPITGFNDRLMRLEGNTTGDRFAFSDPVELWVACRSDKTQVWVSWDEFIDNEPHVVTYRIDSADAIREYQPVSTDYEATFFRSPIALLEKLSGASKLVVRTTPFGESARTVTFQLPTSTPDELSKVATRCHWDPASVEARRARESAIARARQAREDSIRAERQARQDRISAERQAEEARLRARRDSMAAERQAQKAMEQARRDSIGEIQRSRRDSVRAAQEARDKFYKSQLSVVMGPKGFQTEREAIRFIDWANENKLGPITTRAAFLKACRSEPPSVVMRIVCKRAIG